MKELERIYRKHKQRILPMVVGFAAFFVFIRIVLPLWDSVTETQALIDDKTASIEAKESTITLLNSLPDEKVNDDYQVVTTALPLRKDIVLIYTQLTDVANRSNVELGGFSVKVGGVYAAESTKEDVQQVEGLPFLNIIVTVSGENGNMRRFAEELYRSVPLIEINSLDIARLDARYDINFFYKPVVARPQNDDRTSLEAITAAEEAQIEELRSWQTGQ